MDARCNKVTKVPTTNIPIHKILKKSEKIRDSFFLRSFNTRNQESHCALARTIARKLVRYNER